TGSSGTIGFGVAFQRILSCDAGPNASGGFGDVLVVFDKVVSATQGAWDHQVIACLYDQASLSERVVISKAAPESASAQAPGPPTNDFLPNGGGLGVGVFYQGFIGAFTSPGFRTYLEALVPNPSSAN